MWLQHVARQVHGATLLALAVANNETQIEVQIHNAVIRVKLTEPAWRDVNIYVLQSLLV